MMRDFFGVKHGACATVRAQLQRDGQRNVQPSIDEAECSQRCDGLLNRQSKVDPGVALDGSVVSASVIAAGSLKNSAVCDSRLCQLSYARARLCACQLCESLCVRERASACA